MTSYRQKICNTEPWAVMVHFKNARSANLTMMSPGWPIDVALSAEGPLKFGGVVALAKLQDPIRFFIDLVVDARW